MHNSPPYHNHLKQSTDHEHANGRKNLVHDIDDAVYKMLKFIKDCLDDNHNKYIPAIEKKPDKFPWEV